MLNVLVLLMSRTPSMKVTILAMLDLDDYWWRSFHCVCKMKI